MNQIFFSSSIIIQKIYDIVIKYHYIHNDEQKLFSANILYLF